MPRQKTLTIADAVRNVLSGKTADATAPLGFTLSFTRDPDSRKQAADLIALIATQLQLRNFPLARERLTPLIAKTLAYLSKTGLQSPEAIANLHLRAPDFALAIASVPEKLTDSTSLAGILRAYQQQSDQQAAALRATLPPLPSARPVIWQSHDQRTALLEVVHPQHLREDTAALDHCAGKLYDTPALEHHRMEKGAPGSEAFLLYWRAIKNGFSRIFTVTHDNDIRFTLEYNRNTRSIAQISGKLRQPNVIFGQPDSSVRRDDIHLPALCAAVSGLKETIPVHHVFGLPMTYCETVLTPEGTFEPLTPDNINSALSGSIAVMPSIPRNILTPATRNPRFSFILQSPADARHLPASIKGWVYITHIQAHARLPSLRHGNVAFNGTSLSVPLLETGQISAPQLTHLDAPRLSDPPPLLR